MVNTTINCNYRGTQNVTEAFKPLIKDNGRIIMVSSRGGCLDRVLDLKNDKFKNDANKLSKELLDENLSQETLDKIVKQFIAAVEKDKSLSNAPFKQSAYGMSKAAMSGYSRILAKELVSRKIFVAAYCPGYCVCTIIFITILYISLRMGFSIIIQSTYMSSGGGDRTASNGARGVELLCLENLSLDKSGKFWGVNFADAKNENNTATLTNYNWIKN